jgi:hypothetical protein
LALTWYAQQVRLTLFTVEKLRPQDPSDLWEGFTDIPPETDIYTRAQNQRRQTGAFGDDALLELRIQPERLDWYLNPLVEPTNREPPNLGHHREVTARVLKLLDVWVPKAPMSFWRPALGVILFSPVDTRREGYQILSEIAPSIQFNLEDEISDFMFQINRPKLSKVINSRKINRLMKWSVGLFQGFTVTISPNSTQEDMNQYACRVELDINAATSIGTQVALDSTQIPAIFEEFVKMVDDIALKGELA